MRRFLLFCVAIFLIFGDIFAQNHLDSQFAGREALDAQAAKMESAIWSRFYSPVTNLFYDYLTSYELDHTLDLLPTDEEVSRLFPNVCGYGTGMEDCMISGGVVLSGILDEYAVTGNEKLREKANAAFKGIERCANVHGSLGFIARGISPFAPEKVYINSSRDQVTHAVYSVWEYAVSPLCDAKNKERAGKLLGAVADKMLAEIKPENDYGFLCADGSACRYGICKMENVMEHEAARLVMIYAAAWDITGCEKYRTFWRNKIEQALEESQGPLNVTTYGLLQMQCSLDLLFRLEPDKRLQKEIADLMLHVAKTAAARAERVNRQLHERDLTEKAPNWRQVGGLVGEYRKTWYTIREAGEIALTILLISDPAAAFDSAQKDYLADALLLIDFDHVSSCGIFDLYGAWWKARRFGIF